MAVDPAAPAASSRKALLIAACVVLVAVGLFLVLDAASRPGSINCDQGFRPDRFETDRLRTAQAAVRCRWLFGWSEARIERNLGHVPFREGNAGDLVAYDVGTAGGLGPTDWFLVVRFSKRGGVVTGAHLERRAV